MNRKNRVLAAGLFAVFSSAAFAADAVKEKPGVVDAVAASVTATVEEIDYKTRTVTLKGPDGTLDTMQIGPEAARFNEVKKGDEVTIDYMESVVISVQPPDPQVASAEGSKATVVRNKGAKPSGEIVETNVTTAIVEKINAKKRTATLRRPDGTLQNVDIQPDVENLENVKKGDQVFIRHTRRVGIDVRKPKK
jgi:Cu/Ag efflux protein CusF